MENINPISLIATVNIIRQNNFLNLVFILYWGTLDLQCFQIVVLVKTLESPLDNKEIKPVNPKQNQPWIFIGRTDAEAEAPTLATWCEVPTHWERPWCWERLRAGGEGDDRGWDGWMVSPTQWTWVWASSGRERRTGKLGVLQAIEAQRTGHDFVTEQQQQKIPRKVRCWQEG